MELTVSVQGHPDYHNGEFVLFVDPSSVQSASKQRERCATSVTAEEGILSNPNRTSYHQLVALQLVIQ